MRVAILVAVLCAAVGARTEAPLRVGVAAATLPAELVRQTCAEADAIWLPSGVAILWRTDDRAADVRVVFDTPPAVADGRPMPLGWLFFHGGAPESTIHLSLANTLRLLDESTAVVGATEALKPWQRDTLVARALGRALAHELGHFLLGSALHAPHGLMKAQRTGAEMFEPVRLPFAIDRRMREAASTQIAVLAPRR